MRGRGAGIPTIPQLPTPAAGLQRTRVRGLQIQTTGGWREDGGASDSASASLPLSPTLFFSQTLLLSPPAKKTGKVGAEVPDKKGDSGPWGLGKVNLASDTHSQETDSIVFVLSEIVYI